MPITNYLTNNARDFEDEISLVEINPQLRTQAVWKEFELVEPDFHAGYRKELSWRAFDEQANRVANMLLAQGVQREDKVAILLMNCIEWLPIYFGVLKSGAIAVPMNFRYAADEIQYCLDLADVSVLLFGPEFTERVAAVKDDIPGVKQMFFVGADVPAFAQDYAVVSANFSAQPPEIVLRDEDNAAIYFSSGTTGFPKAILHDHASLMCAAEIEQKHHNQQRGDVFLCIPPLYHTGAKMHWFGSLVSGSKGVLLRGIDPKWILEAASDEKATIVWLLVPWAQDILHAIESGAVNLADYDLSHWRLMHIGAQPVPPSLVRRWLELFPHHQYDTNYGLSESIGPGCVHLGVENVHKVGAIGKAGYGWKTKIVDEKGNTLAQGEVGELAVSGAGLMKCYYKNPKETAAILKDGWLHTGDMAREDEDGFLFLVDRKKDVIITGGENLYPVQIEDFLHRHSKIKDVAVIGLADARLGEIAAAIIELKPEESCTQDEIMAFCEELPRYKRPRQIIFANIPRNPTGKIEKPKLREKYAGGSVVSTQIGS